MKGPTLADPSIVFTLKREILRSRDARYDHRLHVLLLVAQGMTCPDVASALGDAPRTVQYWIRSFQGHGFEGIRERNRPGRPSRLKLDHWEFIEDALKRSPENFGLSALRWDGRSLSQFIQNNCQVFLSVRQCQRLIRQFELRPRTPIHS